MENIPQPPKPDLQSTARFHTIRLMILTNILTALLVAGIFYFGNIPTYQTKLADQATMQTTAHNVSAPVQLSNNDYDYNVNTLSPQSVVTLNLNPSQAITWKEQDVQYTITSISYGKYKLNALISPESTNYKVGDIVPGVSFGLKIFSPTAGCASLPQLRRVDAQNDFFGPNNRQFYFVASGGCSMQADVTYMDQKLNFIVPPDLTEFTFSYPYTGKLGVFKFKIVDNQIVLEP
ncbi:MAG TPA: hypothetical protein VFX17_02570 [Patescibacteria group bacterium]|nr:hypothetical protein [Patescibacteria group bacterium]